MEARPQRRHELSAPAPLEAVYAWEHLADFIAEALPALERHHAECEPLAQQFPLDPDFNALFQLDADGRLRCFVARVDGVFAGVNAFLVVPTLLRRTVVTADELVFVVAPEWRESWIGFKLIRKAEPGLKAAGAHVVRYTPVSDYDLTPLLKRAQYHHKGGIWEKAL